MTTQRVGTNRIANNSITTEKLWAEIPNRINAAFDAANNATDTYVRNHANAAFDAANTKLPLSGGTVTGDLSVSGNLTVTGNTFTLNVGTLVSNDSVILLAAGNYTTDLLDIGVIAHYNAGTNAHTGFVRDHITKEWYLFKEYTPEIGANNNINTNDPSFRLDTLNANVKSNTISSNTVTFRTEYDNGNSGTAITINFGVNQKQKLTLNANTTLTFTAPPGVGNFLLKIVQDGTGGRLITWPNTIRWTLNARPILTSNANAIDIVSFYYDGTNYFGVTSFNFAAP